MKDKKQKQNATNNGKIYFYCEIVLRNEKLQSSSNQVQNFVSSMFTTKQNYNSKKWLRVWGDGGTSLSMNKGR